MDMAAWEASERELVAALTDENAAIIGVHSVHRDGDAVTVYTDLASGVTRVYTFRPGMPPTFTDHDT